MALETGVTYIEDLVTTNPPATDTLDESDNHHRIIKTAVKGSFPNLGAAAVTKTASEINDLVEQTDPVLNGSITGTAPKVLLNQKVIDIGDWNMDTTSSVAPAHGLTFSKITDVSVSIFIDDDIATKQYFQHDETDLTYTNNGTTIEIVRVLSGFYDSANFDKTSFNRGYITILYED